MPPLAIAVSCLRDNSMYVCIIFIYFILTPLNCIKLFIYHSQFCGVVVVELRNSIRNESNLDESNRSMWRAEYHDTRSLGRCLPCFVELNIQLKNN